MLFKKVFPLLILFIFLFHSDTSAFDGQRKGFFGSGGIGLGATYQESRNDWVYVHRTRGNLSGNFRLGFAPSNRLLAHAFINMDLFYPDELIDLLLVFFGVHSHFLLGIGSNYYFKDNSPSLFFEGGVGASVCHIQYKKETNPEPPDGIIGGLGLLTGIGYEFAKDGSIELQIIWLHRHQDKVTYENQFDVVSVMLTLNVWKF